MSEGKHTPGPWIVKRRFDVYEDTGTPGVGGTFIASTKGNNPLPENINQVCEADAHLIAAAPELLHELRESTKDLAVTIGNIAAEIQNSKDAGCASRWEGVLDHLQEQVRRNNAAIDKAINDQFVATNKMVQPEGECNE